MSTPKFSKIEAAAQRGRKEQWRRCGFTPLLCESSRSDDDRPSMPLLNMAMTVAKAMATAMAMAMGCDNGHGHSHNRNHGYGRTPGPGSDYGHAMTIALACSAANDECDAYNSCQDLVELGFVEQLTMLWPWPWL